ncbi:MAG: sigma-70 family RNA polymerase sigma factor [Vicinamibacterales bacterium]
MEQQLVDRLRAGDDSAVSDLAALYGPKIFQLAIRYMKNREDAEEVVQDVLLKIYRKIDAFRGDAALSSWIYRITFNTAMSRLRHTRAMRMSEVFDEGLEPRQDPADHSGLADEVILRRQMRERLLEAVDDLPAIYREPVILRDLRGMSTEEASNALRLKDQTLKSRLHRGRLLLRKRLADFSSGLTMHRPIEAF